MHYVAFDLDNTLGYFETVGPLAYFFSPDFLSNVEQSVGNPPIVISTALRNKLAFARNAFATALVERSDILYKVLRPNIDVMIEPILEAKRKGHDVTVIIYSNTGNTFSTHLAKALIEKKFKCPGLISLIADVFHPLRKPETTESVPAANGFLNPDKTYQVLVRLLKEAANRHAPIHPEEILFVDDRQPLHRVAEAAAYGLTYIQAYPFAPKLKPIERREILRIALECIDRAGLLSNNEYLGSAICNRSVGNRVLRGFPDVFSYVWKGMNETYYKPVKWQSDSVRTAATIRRFFAPRLESERTGPLPKQYQ